MTDHIYETIDFDDQLGSSTASTTAEFSTLCGSASHKSSYSVAPSDISGGAAHNDHDDIYVVYHQRGIESDVLRSFPKSRVARQSKKPDGPRNHCTKGNPVTVTYTSASRPAVKTATHKIHPGVRPQALPPSSNSGSSPASAAAMNPVLSHLPVDSMSLAGRQPFSSWRSNAMQTRRAMDTATTSATLSAVRPLHGRNQARATSRKSSCHRKRNMMAESGRTATTKIRRFMSTAVQPFSCGHRTRDVTSERIQERPADCNPTQRSQLHRI